MVVRRAQVLEKIDEADDGGIERTRLRATKALTGLGFTPELLARKTSELSGGWRMRVSTMIVAGVGAAFSKDWRDDLAGRWRLRRRCSCSRTCLCSTSPPTTSTYRWVCHSL